jgi:hypothetical protein
MTDVTLLDVGGYNSGYSYSRVLINDGAIASVHFATVDVIFFAHGHSLDGFGHEFPYITPYKAIIKVGNHD